MLNFSQINRQLDKCILVMAALFALMSVSLQATAADQNPQAAWERVDSGAVLIDVRTPAEFAQSHLKNAINIPFEYILQGVDHYKIAKDTPIVVYCRSGRRSGIANQELLKAGYSNAYNGGGFVPLLQHRQRTASTH